VNILLFPLVAVILVAGYYGALYIIVQKKKAKEDRQVARIQGWMLEVLRRRRAKALRKR
jgi:hypothetical protein